MSWLSRLHKIKEANTQHFDLGSVFVSGSKFTIDKIIDRLSVENPWADISKISLSTMQKNLDLIKNNRFGSKIYKHCDLDLLLIQAVDKHLVREELILKRLVDIFLESSKMICAYESDASMTIFILNLTYAYFEKHIDHREELLLYSSAALALVCKRHLFPFIDFIIISDYEEPKNCDESIHHIQQKLKAITPPIKIYSQMDQELIIKLIMTAHTTRPLIEFELV